MLAPGQYTCIRLWITGAVQPICICAGRSGCAPMAEGATVGPPIGWKSGWLTRPTCHSWHTKLQPLSCTACIRTGTAVLYNFRLSAISKLPISNFVQRGNQPTASGSERAFTIGFQASICTRHTALFTATIYNVEIYFLQCCSPSRACSLV